MYLIKNAWTNITRSKGRTFLISIILIIVTLAACITFEIYESGTALIDYHENNSSLEVHFSIDRATFRKQEQMDSSLTISPMTAELVQNIGSSSYLNSYYYTLEQTVSSDQIEAVTDNFFQKAEQETPKIVGPQEQGNYHLIAYSDISYIDNFLSGVSKIITGTFFDNNATDPVIVINEELAIKNNLTVGDTITFYQDSGASVELTIVGIYTTTEETDSMNRTRMNQGNQIYTTLTTMNTYFKTEKQNSVNAYFYLKNKHDLDAFVTEARHLGLSEFYTASTNEEELLKALEPIRNLSQFSLLFFLLVVLVSGIIIIVINIVQMRERKYEIGVLRAIGMSKEKVMLQVLIELSIVAILSLTLGTISGVLISQPVTDQLLSSEIQKQQAKVEAIQTNYGNIPKNPEEMTIIGQNETINYIDTLTVETSVGSILTLFGLNLLLTLIGGLASACLINQYDPNVILQNRT